MRVHRDVALGVRVPHRPSRVPSKGGFGGRPYFSGVRACHVHAVAILGNFFRIMAARRIGVVSKHLCREDDGIDVVYSPEVQRAPSKELIVALESTIVSHGMPYPQNYSTARDVEDIIRKSGAVPATICILKGKIHVGLTDEELRYIAQDATRMKKLSRRDVAHAMAMGLDGATTVASTMLLAHLVGIRVFVTGGIGGVHRSFLDTMDVSADLTELGRTPVTVVCAGAKSILDIPKTMEYLETQGVCVAGYKTDEFPAFYTAKSNVRAPCRFDSAEEVARTILCSSDVLGITSGMVVGVPPPSVVFFEDAIEQALQEAKENSVRGAAETPFVLKRVAELTQGESLKVNITLVKNNAQVGAEIARELHSLCAGKIGF